MNSLLTRGLVLILSLSPLSLMAIQEYTLGGNYALHSYKPSSRDSTTHFQLSLLASSFYNQTHELGAKLEYSLGRPYSSQDSAPFMASGLLGIFYRYHVPLFQERSSFPIFFYIGPGLGIGRGFPEVPSQEATWVGGLDLGFHLFITPYFALDIMIINFSTPLNDQHYLLRQSLGVRFFF